jgi:hypothetical protein
MKLTFYWSTYWNQQVIFLGYEGMTSILFAVAIGNGTQIRLNPR